MVIIILDCLQFWIFEVVFILDIIFIFDFVFFHIVGFFMSSSFEIICLLQVIIFWHCDTWDISLILGYDWVSIIMYHVSIFKYHLSSINY